MRKVVNISLVAMIILAQTYIFGITGKDSALAAETISTQIIQNGENVIVLGASSVSENGKITVQGTVQNASSTNRVIGLAAIGYDENNLPVDTTVDYTQGTFGGKTVSPGVTEPFTLVLTHGSVIKRVEVLPTGNSTAINMLGYGVYQDNNGIHITGLIENGTNVDNTLKLKVLGLDGNDNVLETKEVLSLNWMDWPGNVKPGEPANLAITINNPKVRKLKVDLPDKVETTTNVVNVLDISGPKIISPTGNVTNQQLSNQIGVKFNEEIAVGEAFDSIQVANGGDYNVSISSDTLTIQLQSGMNFNKNYTVTIPSGAVIDLAGNPLEEDFSYTISTISEASNISDYIIISQNETWSTSRVIDKPLIIAPNSTLTISSGSTVEFLKDVIVYGKMTNNGTLLSRTTLYANKYSFFSGGSHLNYGVIDGTGSFTFNSLVVRQDQYPTPPITIIEPLNESTVDQTPFIVKGQTVPGLKIEIGNKTTVANDSGDFEISVDLVEGYNNKIVTITDVFDRTFTVKQILVTYTTVRDYAQIAVAAIDSLPNVADVTLLDKVRIEDARQKVSEALTNGVIEAEITNLDKLVALEAKISELEQLATEKANAIQVAIDAITTLPSVEQLQLSDKTKVEAARSKVTVALGKGAVATEITNLDKLVALEAKLVEMEQQATEKANAIQAAVVAIAALPSVDQLQLSDKTKVEEARSKVNVALEKGAVATEITNLDKLVALEVKLVELEQKETEKANAIQAAIEAITELPTVDQLQLSDKPKVEEARSKVTVAFGKGATATEITNLDKLVDLEAKLVELVQQATEKVNAIQAAVDAITALPSVEQLQLSDKTKVEAARSKVTVALEKGAVVTEITNLDKLVALEAKIVELEQQAIEKANAIQAAIEAITALPSVDQLQLSDKTKVEEARSKVTVALGKGAAATEITNLNKLVALESRITELENLAREKSNSIQDAIAAITALPSVEQLQLSDKTKVEAARSKVTVALGKGAVTTEITNLDKLVTLEAKIVVLVQQATEKANAIQAAIEAITALPSVEQLQLSDKTKVEAARSKVTVALGKGAVAAEITNLDKLVALEAKIVELEQHATEKANAIQAAIEAITALPTLEQLQLSDKTKVEEARSKVTVALGKGAVAAEITNLDKLVALEAKIVELEQQATEKANAIQAAIEAITALPSVEQLKISDKAKVEEARRKVTEAIAKGATESDITNIDKLIAVEEKLSKLVPIDECFIATAAFGSKFTPAVTILREFRDQVLLPNKYGESFVKFYYKHSPPIANFIRDNDNLRAVVRGALTPLVAISYLALHPALLVLIIMGIAFFIAAFLMKNRRRELI